MPVYPTTQDKRGKLNKWGNGNFATAAESVGLPTAEGATLSAGTLTINGSGFGVKSVAAPKKYSDFNGGTDETLLSAYDADWPAYLTNDGALITIDDAYSGDSCVYNRIGTAHPEGGRGEFDTNRCTVTSEHGKPFVISYKHKQIVVDSDGGTNGVSKHARITSVNGGGGGAYNGNYTGIFSNGQLSYTDSAGSFLQYNGGSGYINSTASLLNDWFTVIMKFVPNSAQGVSDGLLEMEIFHPTGGYQKWSSGGIEPLKSGSTMYSDTMLLGLMVANADTYNAYHTVYEDCAYIDNDLAMVLVTDGATLATSNYCEVQPCATWSDTQISVTNFQQGRLSAGTNYVHIIKSDGTAITPVEVTI